MKTTFRDTFMEILRTKARDEIAPVGSFLPGGLARAVDISIEEVEKNLNKRFGKKAPGYMYDKLEAFMVRELKIERPAMVSMFHKAIQESRKAAENKDATSAAAESVQDETAPAETVPSIRQAILLGSEFNGMIGAVRNCVSQSVNTNRRPSRYIQLHFGSDNTGRPVATAYACDGYRIIRHTVSCSISNPAKDEDWFVEIQPPRIKPNKMDMVTITLDETGTCATVAFDNVSFSYKQEVGRADNKENNFKELLSTNTALAVDEENSRYVWVNPSYLADIVKGVLSGKVKDRQPVKLQISNSPLSPMKIVGNEGKTEAILLPVRHHEP